VYAAPDAAVLPIVPQTVPNSLDSERSRAAPTQTSARIDGSNTDLAFFEMYKNWTLALIVQVKNTDLLYLSWTHS
jgi:hypothetical protein